MRVCICVERLKGCGGGCVERSEKRSRNRWDVLNVQKKKIIFGDRFRMETDEFDEIEGKKSVQNRKNEKLNKKLDICLRFPKNSFDCIGAHLVLGSN